MKKKSVLIIVTMITAAMVLAACGAKSGSEPERSAAVEAAAPSRGNLISVDPENLPKEIKESDLIKEGKDYFINQYDLMDIAKKAKKDIVIESSDGYKITASADGNELTKVPLKKDVKEKETTTKEEGKNSGTNAGGVTNNSGFANTGGNTTGGGSTDTGGNTGGNSSGAESSGGNEGGSTAPSQPATQEPAQPAHTHSYTIYQGGTPATCTSPGTEIYACSCGATITNTTPMTAHSFVPKYRTEDQGWNEDVYSDPVPVCNGCGQSLAGLSEDEMMDHLSTCGPGSYTVKPILIGQQWHSNPVEVIDHYECSVCGAWQ